MTREEYAKRMKKHPDWAPGWDAIDAAFAKLYPEAEPVRFESELHDRAALGGEEYLDGFAVYDTGKGYQHVVTYGLSELYPSMAAFGSEYSKWGYELTLKVRESYAETGTWALDLLAQLAAHFRTVADRLTKDGWRDPARVLGVDVKTLQYQVPGGMLSNLVAQLTAQKALDKLDAVLLEVPKVRKDLGYPPLVTPMSQMVGVQATVNVLTGGRYKNVSKEIKAYVKGEYGRAPGKIDPEVQKLVLGDEKPITQRYADLLEPGFEKAKRELGERAHSDEDVLSYIAFPAQAEAYFEKRDRKEDDNEIHFSIREVK